MYFVIIEFKFVHEVFYKVKQKRQIYKNIYVMCIARG